MRSSENDLHLCAVPLGGFFDALTPVSTWFSGHKGGYEINFRTGEIFGVVYILFLACNVLPHVPQYGRR